VRFAWDVATAPWNDNAQYNGFINTFKNAGAGASTNISKAILHLPVALLWKYQAFSWNILSVSTKLTATIFVNL
jgi:hypothetical protein